MLPYRPRAVTCMPGRPKARASICPIDQTATRFRFRGGLAPGGVGSVTQPATDWRGRAIEPDSDAPHVGSPQKDRAANLAGSVGLESGTPRPTGVHKELER